LNALAFVTDLRARGAALEIEGDGLRVTPSTVLTDSDRATWKAQKPQILAMLAADTSQTETKHRETSLPRQMPPLPEMPDAETLRTSPYWAHWRHWHARIHPTVRRDLSDCEAFELAWHMSRVAARDPIPDEAMPGVAAAYHGIKFEAHKPHESLCASDVNGTHNYEYAGGAK
jgi:hypothetical protein